MGCAERKQSKPGNRYVQPMKLHSVGINNFTCPVSIREQKGSRQQTVATISLQAAMPRWSRESCVEVFTDVLARYRKDMHATIFPRLLAEVQTELQAKQARMQMDFPYFLAKQAPVTGTDSLMEYGCSFIGSVDADRKLLLTVTVPLTTLCPCSKEISRAGAHNQRAEVTLTVQPLSFLWLEELIRLVEGCGSCELYALLKRPDEKFVTEEAYANPMFVEDVVRVVAQKALAHPDIGWFSVGVESFESIHKHSAYAYVDSEDIETQK
jgi:GTP cyclohydrolase I